MDHPSGRIRLNSSTLKEGLKHYLFHYGTVDGSEIRQAPVEGTVVHPIIYDGF